MGLARKIFRCLLGVWLFAGIDVSAQQALQPDSLFNMSIDALLGVEVVTASKVPEPVREIPASVVVITREEIVDYGYHSVEEILENVPGMVKMDDYLWIGTKNFGVRGFFSTGAFNTIAVLLNGVLQRSDFLYDGNPTEKIAVPVDAIDRVEVIRGPMSVIYGSGAFLGAINIITHPPDKPPSMPQISGTIGGRNALEAFGRIARKAESLNINLTASFQRDGGPDVPFSRLMTDTSPINRPAADGGWNLDTDRTGGLLASRRYAVALDGDTGPWLFHLRTVGSEKETVESVFGAGEGNVVHFSSSTASGQYTLPMGGSTEWQTRLTVAQESHWVDDELFWANSYTNNWARMRLYNVETHLHYQSPGGFRLVGGLGWRRMDDFCVVADYPYFQLPDTEVDIDHVTQWAAFAQVNWPVTPRCRLIAGLRLEKVDPYRILVTRPSAPYGGDVPQPPLRFAYDFKPGRPFETIPRLAVIYTLGNNHIVKAMAGKAIMQPSANANLDMVFSPGPDLKPAEIQTLEVNYIGAFSSVFTVNLSLFQNRLDNLISRLNVLDPDQGMRVISANAGKMRTRGLEVGFQCRPTTGMVLEGSVCYQDSENLRDGFRDLELGNSPALLGYFRGRWQASPRWTLALTGRYVDGMASDWDMDNLDADNRPVVDPGDPYQGRIGLPIQGYYALDANLRFAVLPAWGLTASLKGSNLLDQAIRTPATTSNPQFDKGTLDHGRRLILTVEKVW